MQPVSSLPSRIGKLTRVYFQKIQSTITERSDYIAVFFIYVLFTVLFTWPLAANFTTFVNGQVMDIFHELWYLHLTSTLSYGPFFVFSTTSIYYPTGVPLYFQVVSPFNSLIFAALQPFVGEIAAYNFLYMFTFFASAFTMYIFVNYLTKNKYAAFFSGLAFAFAPIHTSQGLAHLNIMSSEFIPLYSYFLVKMVKERKLSNGVYAGAAMVLNALCDLHMLLMVLTITVVFLGFYLLVKRDQILNKPFIKRFGVMTAIACILGVAAYFQTFYGLLFIPHSLGQASAITVGAFSSGKSSSLISFFVPANQNSFFGSLFVPYYTGLTNVGKVPTEPIRSFIGYTVLSMSIIGLIAYRKKKEVFFWGVLSAVGFLIALGPEIQIGGQTLPGIWVWMYDLIPFLSSFRTPYRFDYLVAFGFAVLSGFGVAAIMARLEEWASTKKIRFKYRKLGPTTFKAIVIIILVSLLVVEFIPIPYVEMNAVPPHIYQILAQDRSNYTVIEVPATAKYSSLYMYYQSYYNRPLLDGNIPRIPLYPSDVLRGAPFIDELGQYTPGHEPTNDIINQTTPVTEIAPYVLAEYHVKYIIVHKDLLSPQDAQNYINFITSAIGPPFYQDNEITAFRFIAPPSMGLIQYVRQVSNSSLFSLLNGNWYDYSSTTNSRAMNTFAGLDVYSGTNQMVQFQFDLHGLVVSAPIQVVLNGETIGQYMGLNSTWTSYSTQFLPLNEGLNQLTFYAPDGCNVLTSGHKNKVDGLDTSSNCVSAEFRSIQLVPYSFTQVQTLG